MARTGRPIEDQDAGKRKQRCVYATDEELTMIKEMLAHHRGAKKALNVQPGKQPETVYNPQEDDFTDQSSDDEFIG